MKKPQGYAVETDIASGLVQKERDTFTCARCNCVVIVEPLCNPADLGGVDFRSGRLICKACVSGERSLFEERLHFLSAEVQRLRFSGGISNARIDAILKGRF
ncbi:MAG: hypothetical protein MN733_16360 [Nitrososphaera sp.]|nr:hypothetical protein [Nitrososphaera sp.]